MNEYSNVTDMPSWKRKVGLVFQNYALYPHLTVYDNIAMPLTVEHYKDEYIRTRLRPPKKVAANSLTGLR